MMQLPGGAIRHAWRRLVAATLFTTVAVVTLAVGIGANTAIFSLVYGVLLKPLPLDEPERLVAVWHTAPGIIPGPLNQSPATYLTYRDHGRVFEDIGLWDDDAVAVTGRQEPERVDALRVTDGVLGVLGVQALIGRTFDRVDDAPGSPERIILTYPYWQRKFGGAPDIVGQHLVVEGRPREIIGVLPRSFRFLNEDPSILTPFRLDRSEVFVGNFSYQAVARLKPGVSLEQANADVARMIPLAVESFPLPPGFTREMLDEARLGPDVHPLADDVIGDVANVLWVLLGTVGIVLLIACANVANLFLVRAEGRQQELAIRAALGAGRRQIARELLSESLLLGIVGGALGLVLAYGGLQVLVALEPEGLPRLAEVQIDPLVLLFTLVLSVLSGLLFGLIPVVRLGTSQLVTALKEGGRSSSDGRERHRARTALITAEIALALVLLVGAGLMIRTFQALRSVHPGFVRPAEVLTLRISIPEALIPEPEQAVRAHEQIKDRLEQIPGVNVVGLASSVTMDGSRSADPIFVEAFPGPEGRLPPIRRFKWVSPDYFETMGNPVLAGRSYNWTDNYNTLPVVIVNEKLAREYWEDPAMAVGQRIRESPQNPWREIIGVVGDVRDDGVAEEAPALVYWPLLIKDFWDDPLHAHRWSRYAIRSGRLDSSTFLREIQEAVWSVNPSLPVSSIRTLNEIQSDSMAQTSFALVLLAVAAGVALLLGVVGIYGVIAYAATQRTREIGIRMALGAEPGDVQRLFVRHGLLLTGAGLGLGILAAAGLTRLMSTLLFGVDPLDPVTYVSVSSGLGATALLATYLPARRASRLNPVESLRSGI